MSDKILQVKNLSISFRTGAGKVQAVRDISFDLLRGETLAIVGESGSGKSVTSRAILGITAGNGVHENGVILFEDKDLLQITEDDFHKIRGDKISMVFQDPLSALNPIMRTGKQMTEAMIHNNKADRRDANARLKSIQKNLAKRVHEAFPDASAEEKKYHQEALAGFRRIQKAQTMLELLYGMAREQAAEARRLSIALSQDIDKHIHNQVAKTLTALRHRLKGAVNPAVLSQEEHDQFVAYLDTFNQDKHHARLAEGLDVIAQGMERALNQPHPDFFDLAETKLRESDGNALPVSAEGDFLGGFKKLLGTSLEYTRNEAEKRRQHALETINRHFDDVARKPLDIRLARKALAQMSHAVEAAIEPLDIHQDSQMHTFKPSVRIALDRYRDAISANRREQRRFNRATAKLARAKARGKDSWKVAPLGLTDLDHAHDNLIAMVERMRQSLAHPMGQFDAAQSAEELVAFSASLASRATDKVTPAAARDRAIALMREVGIPQPELRFKQYPFELSGGMRQRIVIAIALSANPDILICDEPTTALDVTIQSQILELINNIKRERGLSIIFITHDLGVVANMADRVAVMYAGKIVEIGQADEVFYEPAHPYTWALLSSMPDLDTKEKLTAIPGTPPNMVLPPKGDAFADRNQYAMAIDFEQQPPLFRITDTHYAATWLRHPAAPKVEPPAIVTERIRRMKEREAAK